MKAVYKVVGSGYVGPSALESGRGPAPGVFTPGWSIAAPLVLLCRSRNSIAIPIPIWGPRKARKGTEVFWVLADLEIGLDRRDAG